MIETTHKNDKNTETMMEKVLIPNIWYLIMNAKGRIAKTFGLWADSISCLTQEP